MHLPAAFRKYSMLFGPSIMLILLTWMIISMLVRPVEKTGSLNIPLHPQETSDYQERLKITEIPEIGLRIIEESLFDQGIEPSVARDLATQIVQQLLTPVFSATPNTLDGRLPTFLATPTRPIQLSGTPTLTETPTLTPTGTYTLTPSGTPTRTRTLPPTPSRTFAATFTPQPTLGPSQTHTSTAAVSSTPSLTSTLTPLSTWTATVSHTPTLTETISSTPSPTYTPTLTPTLTPSLTPTLTLTPSLSPTPSLTTPPGTVLCTNPDLVTGFLPSDDTYINAIQPNTNYGADNEFQVWANDGANRRGLLRFDLSEIPANATIFSATLYIYTPDSKSGVQTAIYRVTAPWSESNATWNSPWNTAGGDFSNQVVYASFSPDTPDCMITVDISGLVTGWVNGSYENHGLMLYSSGVNHAIRYVSKEEGGNLTFRPRLRVVYVAKSDGRTNSADESSSLNPRP